MSGVDPEALASYLRSNVSFANVIGLEIGEIHPGRAVIHLEVKPMHLNGANFVHGGVHASLLDTAMAIALMAHGHTGATSQMNVHYLAPVSSGRLECVGEVVHRSRRTATIEAKVRDQSGELVALAIASFRIFDQPFTFPRRAGSESQTASDEEGR
jgi:uncharacterized protein (TIGR00369 family)